MQEKDADNMRKVLLNKHLFDIPLVNFSNRAFRVDPGMGNPGVDIKNSDAGSVTTILITSDFLVGCVLLRSTVYTSTPASWRFWEGFEISSIDFPAKRTTNICKNPLTPVASKIERAVSSPFPNMQSAVGWLIYADTTALGSDGALVNGWRIWAPLATEIMATRFLSGANARDLCRSLTKSSCCWKLSLAVVWQSLTMKAISKFESVGI